MFSSHELLYSWLHHFRHCCDLFLQKNYEEKKYPFFPPLEKPYLKCPWLGSYDKASSGPFGTYGVFSYEEEYSWQRSLGALLSITLCSPYEGTLPEDLLSRSLETFLGQKTPLEVPLKETFYTLQQHFRYVKKTKKNTKTHQEKTFLLEAKAYVLEK